MSKICVYQNTLKIKIKSYQLKPGNLKAVILESKRNVLYGKFNHISLASY